jgi:hypothetical protein
VTAVGESDRDGLVPVLTTSGVLEGLARDAEEPGTRRGEVGGDVVQSAPRDEHDLTDDVLGVRGVDAPAHEAEQVDVHRLDLPEALFALQRRRSRDVHAPFLSESAQVCRGGAPVLA